MLRPSFLPSLGVGLLAAAILLASPLEAQETAREGITIHGDWVIEVRDPDGSLVERQAFSNDLTSVAPGLLAFALSARGDLAVDLITLTPCAENAAGTAATPCALEATLNVPDPSSAGFGGLPASLVLDASYVVSLPTFGTLNIREVGTIATACDVGTDPCRGTAVDGGFQSTPGAYPDLLPFTETTLPSTIEIADGQTVLVTVTLSFS